MVFLAQAIFTAVIISQVVTTINRRQRSALYANIEESLDHDLRYLYDFYGFITLYDFFTFDVATSILITENDDGSWNIDDKGVDWEAGYEILMELEKLLDRRYTRYSSVLSFSNAVEYLDILTDLGVIVEDGELFFQKVISQENFSMRTASFAHTFLEKLTSHRQENEFIEAVEPGSKIIELNDQFKLLSDRFEDDLNPD